MTQVVSHGAEDNLPTNHPSLLEEVQDTLHFVASLKHKTFVAKLGGSTLAYQRAVLQDLVWLHELGVKVVLVHGGGPSITAWLAALADVPRVHIVDGSTPHVLLYELEDHPHVGTTIVR